ncbi:hypothetical protein SEA_PRIAMO_49 [Mycobacterium phage Priamo]|uniref:Uncharacterized protein n=1 Tax=Mycobacterium phage Priamo TaxID=2182403 RepID=A0A2U8UQB8_9CAUD|nr:hypothetical protein KIP55_gp061 [Mycobacterium phage Priamo]AWN05812.1 hypothetical protein SEA_PRIAMO_49 [Mycobacterium phage Priamo]
MAVAAAFMLVSEEIMKEFPDSDDCPDGMRDFAIRVSKYALDFMEETPFS